MHALSSGHHRCHGAGLGIQVGRCGLGKEQADSVHSSMESGIKRGLPRMLHTVAHAQECRLRLLHDTTWNEYSWAYHHLFSLMHMR